MSAAERASEASSAEQANEWAVRANERADERMAQYSTRQFHNILALSGLVATERAEVNVASDVVVEEVPQLKEEAAGMGKDEETLPAVKDDWEFSFSDDNNKENVAPVHYG